MSGTWPDCRGQLVGEQIKKSVIRGEECPRHGGGGHSSAPSTTLQIRAGAGSPLTPRGWLGPIQRPEEEKPRSSHPVGFLSVAH